jgi:hypothetical protein
MGLERGKKGKIATFLLGVLEAFDRKMLNF